MCQAAEALCALKPQSTSNGSRTPPAGRAIGAQTARPANFIAEASPSRGDRISDHSSEQQVMPDIPISQFAYIRAWVAYGMMVTGLPRSMTA